MGKGSVVFPSNTIIGEVMDLSMLNVFAVAKGERKYVFSVPQGAPYGEAIDSCFEILTKLTEMQKQALDSLKKEEEAKPAESVIAEVAS